MASEAGIKAAIEGIVNSYPIWTIGVTDDLARRRREHGERLAYFSHGYNGGLMCTKPVYDGRYLAMRRFNAYEWYRDR